MDKKEIRIKIHDLFEVCKVCVHKTQAKQDEVNEECINCDTYLEIRKLGDLLQSEKEVMSVQKRTAFEMSIEEYVNLKRQGLKDREIAEMKGVDSQKIANWKYQRKDKIQAALEGKGSEEMSKEEVVKKVEKIEVKNDVAEKIEVEKTEQVASAEEKQINVLEVKVEKLERENKLLRELLKLWA